ncbi:MAG: hypothetical protein JW940_02835, partial [Polyangiaceae bacterium]|nr:hypothetical protein [Polyangiaceae bacterium]
MTNSLKSFAGIGLSALLAACGSGSSTESHDASGAETGRSGGSAQAGSGGGAGAAVSGGSGGRSGGGAGDEATGGSGGMPSSGTGAGTSGGAGGSVTGGTSGNVTGGAGGSVSGGAGGNVTGGATGGMTGGRGGNLTGGRGGNATGGAGGNPSGGSSGTSAGGGTGTGGTDVCPKPQAQACYYVSPAGSDAADGSVATPFQTITKARDAVRAVNAAMTGDIYVYLRGGEYRLTGPITLESKDSGTGTHRIYYAAYPGETPVVNGATQVTGWTQDKGNIYKAALDRKTKLRNLYVNDARA